MKLMGVDYGRRRTGVAVTDESGTCVRGLICIDKRDMNDRLNRLREAVERESPDAIVFGLALGPDQEETAISSEVRAFAKKLGIMCNRPVNFIDESFSSKDAENLLRWRPRKKRQEKSKIDLVSACLILEQYIRELS